MKNKTITLFLLVIVGLNGINHVIPNADAHDIQAYPATRFVQIEDETFDKQYMQTGETLIIQGKITSHVDKNIRGMTSIFSESSNANNRWKILARVPPETVFDVPSNSTVKYSISAKALEPGTYHVHTQFNIDKIGPELGPGQTIVVEGESLPYDIPFTNIAYQLAPIIMGSIVLVTIVYYFRRRIRK